MNSIGTQYGESGSEWPHLVGTDEDGMDPGEPGLEGTGSLIRPIHLAAFFDLHQIVERLLLGGADVDELDNDKATALHWALLGNTAPQLSTCWRKEPIPIGCGKAYAFDDGP